MLAAWYAKNGSAQDVLQYGEQPQSQPAEGEVLVQLVCSGVNPSDVKSRGGTRPVREGIVIPHSDGAGMITAVGKGVETSRIGERVWIWNGQYNRPLGTAAEFIALPSQQAVQLPDAISFEAGACLGIPALTAYRAVELAHLEPGQTVLVIGGTSGVAFYAAQMARLHGARVISTVGSQEKAKVLQDAGFDDIVFYKTESVADRVKDITSGAGVNAIIDMDFSTSSKLVDEGVLATHGQFVCYGSNAREVGPLTFGSWLMRSITLSIFLVYELTPAQRSRALNGLQDFLREDSLKHLIGEVFPLQDIIAAHQAVENGKVIGNVVMRCDDA
ncbi:NADPH:quinone reductase [Pusillimonas sp. ANT_WB101]|uniref:NADPH:quinone reductase n=1 Tax=Pusillimonas sp. ANT_WB101 TaxID=2597356 RepID=UPI0011F07105|nr:NADPH:quinone reductase [Pusillimonas sp. ANT_WB101]KAA0892701.1 NADPH:quinone reductase [Pusillimonas sp. ANT_WB101]